MNQQSIDCLEMSTGDEPVGSVIWLHGLGADGHDFEPLVPQLRLQDTLPLRFIFPHAPVRPVTLNGGMAMRAWYDLVSLERNSPQDLDGIEESAETVNRLIRQEIKRGIAAKNIVIAGFSQGGAVALHAALRYPERLGGLIALSTYLPKAEELEQEASAANRELPIFMAHGAQDPVVQPSLGEASFRHLERLGYAVKWRTYPMPHAVCPQEIDHIRAWLLNLFGRGE
ncbi:alpha/beta hydrolase [Natronospira bacteriovora]|uniref:Alpha/beta fold hydrolase n=1 Tax=Natronospira bacteriovora TaxID=3069753 RepID=A0ABU0W7B7_9GAMM|nr:alpha/beta fold hydrolase [Natronospira sp. AB-CW4]MDQ2069891.1 alpha/beta fold hydrolase [Natronospira sp. AB-CW4]